MKNYPTKLTGHYLLDFQNSYCSLDLGAQKNIHKNEPVDHDLASVYPTKFTIQRGEKRENLFMLNSNDINYLLLEVLVYVFYSFGYFILLL